MKSINIKTYNRNDFVNESASVIKDLILELTQKQTQINIALSGGNSPLPIYEKLRSFNLDWSSIRFFVVDERCVPSSNIENNYKNICEVLFNYVSSITFPIIKEGLTYFEAAVHYEEQIREHVNVVNGIPQFDLLVLGMGLDGHTASLFPKTKALKNKTDLVVLNKVPQLNTDRITMTYPLIMNSNKIVLIANGPDKKKILDNVFKNEYPISKIIPKIYIILN